MAPLLNTSWFKGRMELMRLGEMGGEQPCSNRHAGMIAVSDCTTVPYKQIVIAAGDGSKAALGTFLPGTHQRTNGLNFRSNQPPALAAPALPAIKMKVAELWGTALSLLFSCLEEGRFGPMPATQTLSRIAFAFSSICTAKVPEESALNALDVLCGSTLLSDLHRCSGVSR